jgi:anaerobic dimethyl sulfoxide reductase subunit B (iron-sulfur subunit)
MRESLMEKGFLFDVSRCVGCYACVVACKDQNDIQEGSENWRDVEIIEQGTYPEVSLVAVSLACMHCGDPPCKEGCPVKAIHKRREDGIVIVDEKRCIGCNICVMVCPFGAPKIGKNRKIRKCHYCLERTSQGLEPACVRVCPFGALYGGTVVELQKEALKRGIQKFIIGRDISSSLRKI